jgi:hypothetical protein
LLNLLLMAVSNLKWPINNFEKEKHLLLLFDFKDCTI